MGKNSSQQEHHGTKVGIIRRKPRRPIHQDLTTAGLPQTTGSDHATMSNIDGEGAKTKVKSAHSAPAHSAGLQVTNNAGPIIKKPEYQINR